MGHVYGYTLSLDMTRRDLQGEMKKSRRSWEVGKASANSAPIGPIQTVEVVGHLDNDVIILKVNGDLRQGGDLNQSIGKTPEMISCLTSAPSGQI